MSDGVCVCCVFPAQGSSEHVEPSPPDDPGHGGGEQRGAGGVLQPLPVHRGGQHQPGRSSPEDLNVLPSQIAA